MKLDKCQLYYEPVHTVSFFMLGMAMNLRMFMLSVTTRLQDPIRLQKAGDFLAQRSVEFKNSSVGARRN